MRARVGHARPVGTTWRMRLHSWDDPDRPPALNDYVCEDPVELRRGYLVVGVEETNDPTRYRVVLERLKWAEFEEKVAEGHPLWTFVRDRR